MKNKMLKEKIVTMSEQLLKKDKLIDELQSQAL
jgi:hypothetical protein